MTLLAALKPAPRAVLIALVALGVLMIVFGVMKAHARMEVTAIQRELCAERLRSLRARNPFTERWMLPAEPCQALAVLATEGRP